MKTTKNIWATMLVCFAYILIVGNVLFALIYPFAAEAYLKMQPTVNNFLPIGVRTAMFAVNALAAFLIVRQYWTLALIIFALASALIFSDMVYARGVTPGTIVFSFWDFLVLAVLVYLARRHASKRKLLELNTG